jgi:hypothetical protein
MNEPAMRIEDPKSENEIDPFLPHAIPYCPTQPPRKRIRGDKKREVSRCHSKIA